MAEVLPTIGEDVQRLLATVNTLPIRMRERDRLIRGLDMVASEAWFRVEVALEAEQLEQLRWADQFWTPNDLSHVLALARTIAAAYDFPTVNQSHIAVALAASSRELTDRVGVIETISHAFGLGTLERVEDIRSIHLNREELGTDSPTVTGDSSAWTTPTRRGEVALKVSLIVDATTRTLVVAALVLQAAQSDLWYAWLLPFVGWIPTRQPDTARLVSVENVPRFGRLARWPLTGILAVLAAAFGLAPQAAALTVAFLVLEVTSAVGEGLQARAVRFIGPDVRREGDAAPLLSALAQYPDRYALHPWEITLILSWGMAIPVALLSAPFVDQWPLATLIVVFAARRLVLPAITAAVLLSMQFMINMAAPMWPALAFSIVCLALGLVAQALITYGRHAPTLPLPVRWELVTSHRLKGMLLEFRVRRLLRAGRPSAALITLEDGLAELGLGVLTNGDVSNFAALRAWALLKASRPGEAKRVARTLGPQDAVFRAYVDCAANLDLGRLDEAGVALDRGDRLQKSGNACSAALAFEWILLAARIELAHGRTRGLAGALASLVPGRVGPDHIYRTVSLMRLTAEACGARSRDLGMAIALGGWAICTTQRGEAVSRFYSAADSARWLDIEAARTLAIAARLEPHIEPEQLALSDLTAFGPETGHRLFELHQPFDAARALEDYADRAQRVPALRLAALTARIDAVASLNQIRHDTFDQEDRRHWWRVFSACLEKAMAQAAEGKDWPTLAELIETARLQLVPDSATDESWAVARQVPFVRVRGVSQLENSSWSVPGERPDAFELESIAAVVLGPETVWWSTWIAGENLYWSLVPPEGPVEGGRMPRSDIAEALSSVRDALPIVFEGEAETLYERRMEDSPLCGPLAAERRLAAQIGSMLPGALIRRVAEGGVALAIAPAPQLAVVPWAIATSDALGHDVRLIERCRLAIAPPAALVAKIAARNVGRTDTTPNPLRAAVVDPGGDLPAANALGSLLPSNVALLTHEDEPSVDDIASLLQGTERASTFLFAGHTSTPGVDHRAALFLGARHAASDAIARLSITSDMLLGQPKRFPLPRQLMLLACGSGDVQNVRDGEWTTLGPAALWAGADRAVITSFPVIDSSDLDAQLIAGLKMLPLDESLRVAQLRMLDSWRTTSGELGAPMHWAGHVALGAFALNEAVLGQAARSRQRYVAESFVQFIDSAAGIAVLRGDRNVRERDMFTELAVYGWDEDLALWRRPLVWILKNMILLPTHFASLVKRRPGQSGESTDDHERAYIDEEVLRAIRAASETAIAARHRILVPEHLLVSLLQSPKRAMRVARVVSGWDARHPEVQTALLGERERGFNHTGAPRVSHLSADAVAAIYDAAGVAMPEASEPNGWYFTDR